MSIALVASVVALSCPAFAGPPDSLRSRVDHVIDGHDARRLPSSDNEVLVEVAGPRGRPSGKIRLWHDAPPFADPRVVIGSYFVTVDAAQPQDENLPRVVALVRQMEQLDDGGRAPSGQRSSRARYVPYLEIALGAALLALVVGLLRRPRITLQFKLSHAIPAAIQSTLFAYWSIYWPGTRIWIPVVLSQIVLAYALDAIVQTIRTGAWRVGFGPVPIVLSANLFAWWNPAGAVFVLAGALISREFIRRGERHILNPSAAGLSFAGIAWLAAPSLVYFDGVFHTLQIPPNMSELLVFLALVPQVRLPIVLVSVGAALMASGLPVPVDLGMGGILLTLALFATDPATIPETPVGRLLFGAFLVVGIALGVWLLRMARLPDDLAKAFPVPVLNALAPLLDRLGRRARSSFWVVLAPRFNLAHLAIWLLLVSTALYRTKRHTFEAALHWSYGTPLVIRAQADDVPHCRDNPVFCRPFSFVSEAEAWAARFRSGSDRGR